MEIFILTTLMMATLYYYNAKCFNFDDLKKYQATFLTQLESTQSPAQSDSGHQTTNQDIIDLKETTHEAQLRGVSLRRGLNAYYQILNENNKSLNSRFRLWNTIWFRFFAGLLLALLARIVLVSIVPASTKNGAGVMELIICCGLYSSVLVFLSKSLSYSWFWNRTLTQNANDLLQCFVFFTSNNDFPPSKELYKISTSERMQGISLTERKMAYLKSWSNKRFEKERSKIAKLEDLMPLIEIVCIGSAGILLNAELVNFIATQ